MYFSFRYNSTLGKNTCIGAIMTPDPPGDGIIKAGTGPPAVVPGKGLLLGLPLPRFTVR